MKASRILIATVLTTIIALLQCSSDNSEVIESLDGEKITVQRFEKAYETALEATSRQAQMDKKDLMELLAKDPSEVPEAAQNIVRRFQKENFYEEYRTMLMTKLVADRNGFTSRPDIQQILDYLEMQIISQIYVQEQVEKKIKISDEAAMEECQRIRKESPQAAAAPINECLQFARRRLKSQESQANFPKVIERIKESVTIKHNNKFDLDAYLKRESNNTGTTDSSATTPDSGAATTPAASPANPQ